MFSAFVKGAHLIDEHHEIAHDVGVSQHRVPQRVPQVHERILLLLEHRVVLLLQYGHVFAVKSI